MIPALVATFAILAVGASHPPLPKSPSAAERNPAQAAPGPNQTNAPAGNTSPPITVVVQAPPEDPATKARAEKREERSVTAAEQMVTLSVILIAATAITLGIIGWQAWETRKSAGAAKQSADAAKTSAQAARDALMLNRPFLELINGRVENLRWLDGPPAELQIRFDIYNYGQTAARIDYVERRVSLLGEPDAVIENTDEIGMMVAPGACTPLAIYVGGLGAEEQALYASAEKRLLLETTGRIVYVDQFGETHRRRFGWICQCSHNADRTMIHPLDTPGHNDEEGWGQKRNEQGQP